MIRKLLTIALAGAVGTPAYAELEADWAGIKPEQMIAAYRLAECVVRSDPRGAQQLLATLPGSKENVHANRALVPAVEACWTAQSSGDLRIGSALLRGAIAEVIYHRIATSQGRKDPYAVAPKDDK